MAPTFAKFQGSRVDLGEVTSDMTCDSAYPGSGGYPVTAANLGMLDMPDSMSCELTTAQGVKAVYNKGASKIQLLKGAAGLLVECASADITSSVVVRCVAKGRPII